MEAEGGARGVDAFVQEAVSPCDQDLNPPRGWNSVYADAWVRGGVGGDGGFLRETLGTLAPIPRRMLVGSMCLHPFLGIGSPSFS